MSFRDKHWPTARPFRTDDLAELNAWLRRGLSLSTFGRGLRMSKAAKKAEKSMARRNLTLRLHPSPHLPRVIHRDRRFDNIARTQAALEDPDDLAYPDWMARWRPHPEAFLPDPWLQAFANALLQRPAFPQRPCGCAACTALRLATDEDH